MRYPGGCVPDIDAAIPKLLGVYEQEIGWVFERGVTEQVPAFIDIGCADGYYAVGMAHASPATTTFAYDLSSSARRLCAETAVASAVDGRVRIGKRFSVGALASIPVDRALLLCDIEGAEVQLLDRAAATALAASVVVVEVHEDSFPGASDRLRRAFADSHHAMTVNQRPRLNAPQQIAGWSADERSRVLCEFRGSRLHWIVFEPRAA
jgi:hypothetical protein